MGLLSTILGSAGAALPGLIDGDDNTVRQGPLLTPEQSQAQQALLNFGQTGQLGDFRAGQAFGGSLGDFDVRQNEALAQDSLGSLLRGGLPSAIGTAQTTLNDLSSSPFDQESFDAFKRQALRAQSDANDILNREAAITGDRFNTGLLRERANLAERTSDALTTRLADLFNIAQNRRLNAANSLASLGGLQENINQGRIGSGFQFGGLERNLANQKAQAELNEFNRQRQERLGSIGALNSVLGNNVPFGVSEFSAESPSILSEILGPVVGQLGTSLGNRLGGLFGRG